MTKQPGTCDEIRRKTCERVGVNLYGRVDVMLACAERGRDDTARQHLLALLKFFPKVRNGNA